jgi:hypothetical protein
MYARTRSAPGRLVQALVMDTLLRPRLRPRTFLIAPDTCISGAAPRIRAS